MKMKIALIHDWLIGLAGGEKVLEALIELYDGPIYTLFKDQKVIDESPFAKSEIHTSFLQRVPHIEKRYRNLFPFYPKAIESLDLSAYDLIFSSSHAVAKGVKKRKDQLHICYCFTPVRYAWDLSDFHFSHLNPIKRAFASPLLKNLRNWDLKSSERVDHFVAISNYIAQRIKANYGREASVIYPPVDTDRFEISQVKEDYYFTCSRFVPYKRIDLIVEAFKRLPSKKLVVIGYGPEWKKIKAKAPKNVELLGYQPTPLLRETLSKARAFLFAAEEDFGIVNVEAQAAGVPVIAYGRGGVLETVLPAQTGLFFQEQTAESLIDAINRFEKMERDFEPVKIKQHAEQFSKRRFQKEMSELVDKLQEQFHSSRV